MIDEERGLSSTGVPVEVEVMGDLRPTLPAPPVAAPANAREVADVMQSYLASNVAMLLFSKLTLYRAIGENPKVVVTFRGMKFRVHIERSNGEKEYFNRDGES